MYMNRTMSFKQFLSTLIAVLIAVASPAPVQAMRVRPSAKASAAEIVSVVSLLSDAASAAMLSYDMTPGLLPETLPALGQSLTLLALPQTVLTANANGNLASLMRQGQTPAAAMMPRRAAAQLRPPGAPQPALQESLAHLQVANRVLSRFNPQKFSELSGAQLLEVLGEIYDGLADLDASAATPVAAQPESDAGWSLASPNSEFRDLVLRGMSPEMLTVVEGELLYWEPEQREIDPYIISPGDPAPTVSAKVHNETAALHRAWSMIEMPLQEQVTDAALRIADGVVETVAGDISTRKIKADVLLEKALMQMSAQGEEGEARRVLQEELLPALKSRDSLVFLSADAFDEFDLEEFHADLKRREYDLTMIKLYERALRFPFGFSSNDPSEIESQRTIASARKQMMTSMSMSIEMSVNSGRPAEDALKGVEAEIQTNIGKMEKTLIANPQNYTVRANLTTFQELLAAFEATRTGLRTYDHVYETNDTPAGRRKKIAAESERHDQIIASVWSHYKQTDFAITELIATLDASVRAQIEDEGRPILHAAGKFYYQNNEALEEAGRGKENTEPTPIEALMLYSYLARGGNLGKEAAPAERDIIIIAKQIRDEADYEQLRLQYRRHGRIRAIATPKDSVSRMGAGRIPHWVIFAKADGIVSLPLLDLAAAGVSIDALQDSMSLEDGTPSIAVADGKRGQLLLHPKAQTRTEWLSRNDVYHKLDRLYRDRAGKKVSFNGRQMQFWADEADPKTFVDQAGGSEVSRSGAVGIGLFRFEQFMGKLGVEWDQDAFASALGEILTQPFFRGGLPFVIRLYDFEDDKRPHFVTEGRSIAEVDSLIQTHSNARFYLDKSKPSFRGFGRMQLKAIFEAHWSGVPERSIHLLFSNVREVWEIDALEELIAEAREQFVEEEIGRSQPSNPQELERAISDELAKIPVGYMIEDSAAVEKIDALTDRIGALNKETPSARFLGIGTNDLTKSILAGDPLVLDRLSSLHPGLVQALYRIAVSAARHGLEVTVDGEWGSSPKLTLALLALEMLEGVQLRQVVYADRIPEISELVRQTKSQDLEAGLLSQVQTALHAETPPSVETFDAAAALAAHAIEDRIIAQNK